MESLKGQVGGSHYKNMVIQPIEYIVKNNLPYIDGNIIKYVSRWRAKNGVEDLRKARHYIDMLIESETNDDKSTVEKIDQAYGRVNLREAHPHLPRYDGKTKNE